MAARAQTNTPGAWIPNQNEIPPFYFSGTNARIAGAVVCAPNAMLLQCQLRIGGQVAKSWSWQIGEPGQTTQNLGCMFDSSHWPSGTNLQVEIWAMDSQLAEYTATISRSVINRAVVYGRYDLDVDPLNWNSLATPPAWSVGDNSWKSVDVVAAKLAQMNFDTSRTNTSYRWTKDDYFFDLGFATASYVASHGNNSPFTFFVSDRSDHHYARQQNPPGPPDIDGEKEYVQGAPPPYAAQCFPILPVRQAANGIGLPPYNTFGDPPVNVAFVMSCKAGANNSLVGYLYPYGNWYTGAPQEIPENQAFVAPAIDVPLSKYRVVASTFYEALRVGKNAGKARDAAMQAAKVILNSGEPSIWLVVYGDKAAKLHGVYDGNPDAAANTGWVRP